jgi:hypothetical protein
MVKAMAASEDSEFLVCAENQESLEIRRHLEEFALLRAWSAAATDALDTDAHLPHRAVDLHADILQIGLELAPTDAGYLATHAAQVLRLAATRVLIAQYGLLATDGTLHAHGSIRFLLRSQANGGWKLPKNSV